MSANEGEASVLDILSESDFIMGSCSNKFDSCQSTLQQSMAPTTTTTTTKSMNCDTQTLSNSAYAACVRLLTRQIRQTSTMDRDLQCEHDVTENVIRPVESSHDDWKEEYVKASQGIPELLALQNTILQLQHAFHLIQQEANTAIHDTSAAIQSSQCWQREYDAVKQVASTLELENTSLKQQNEALIADKRKLKAACKKLIAQQHAAQSQQVESYVISALVSHETFLTGVGSVVISNDTNHNSSCTGKNRSRTTTLDTTGTTAGFDDFTTLDDPFVNNSPHNGSTIESSSSDSSRNSPKVAADYFEEIPSEMASLSTPPVSEVTMQDDHNPQLQPKQISAQNDNNNKGMNGFDHACHAFGRTFKFIDNHVHKKERHLHPVKCPTGELQSITNNNNNVNVRTVETVTTVVATDSPVTNSRPYAPIRFDVITPTRSEDSNDSVKAHRRKLQSPFKNNRALIDVNMLLDGPKDDGMNNLTIIERNRPTSNHILLSLPTLHPVDDRIHNCVSNPGSVKCESPLSIPEEEEEDDEIVCSDSRIQCQRYSCDPSLLRSMSIPIIPTRLQTRVRTINDDTHSS